MRMWRFFGGNPPDSPFGPLIARRRLDADDNA
jgi:hypothetical protein